MQVIGNQNMQCMCSYILKSANESASCILLKYPPALKLETSQDPLSPNKI